MKTVVRFMSLLLLQAALLTGPAVAGDADAVDTIVAVETIVLVAKPGFTDPLYGQAVLLAAPLPSGEHIGIILNRPTESSLASLFPEHGPSKLVTDPVYFGGPMLTEIMLALVRADSNPGEGSVPMGKDLFLVTHSDVIDRIIEKTPNDAHYFVGTVLWRAGELRQELERGLWSVVDADTDMVFTKNPRKLWEGMQLRANSLSVRMDLPRATNWQQARR